MPIIMTNIYLPIKTRVLLKPGTPGRGHFTVPLFILLRKNNKKAKKNRFLLK